MIGWLSNSARAQMDPGNRELVTIGTGTEPTTLAPIYTPYKYSVTQQIYTSDAIGTDGTISSIGFYYAYGQNKTFNIDVYMTHVAKTSFSDIYDYVIPSSADLVFSGNITGTITNGWINIILNQPFEYDGESNLLITVHNKTGNSFTAYGVGWQSSSTSSNTIWYYGNDYTNPNPLSNLNGNWVNNTRPNLQLEINSSATCKAPKNFATSDITTNSANLTWTAGSEDQTNWDVYYTTSNVAPDENTTPSFQVTDCTKSLTGLTAQTTYYAYVRAACSSTDKSRWVGTNFTTTREACHVGADSPYEQDFETSNDWTFANGNLTNQWCWGSATNNGGTKSMYISKDGGTTYEYAHGNTVVYASKLFFFESGSYTFKFDWNAKGESNYDYLRVAIVPGDMEFAASTSLPNNLSYNSLPSGWIALDGGNQLNLNTSNSWQTKTTEVSVSNTYTMVFVWRNDFGGGTTTPAAIDNISITRAYPMPTSFAAYQVGADYAVLAWQENSGASKWDLQCSTDSSFPSDNLMEISGGTEAGFQVNGNNVGNGFLGLNSGTKYFVRVRSVIGNQHSEWAEASFQTECADLTLPYHCDFEGSLDDSSYPMPLCWNRNGITIQNKTYPYVYESTSSSNYPYAHGEDAYSTNGHCLRFYKTSTTSTETAILPAVASDYEMNQLQVRFWARLYNSTYAGKTLDIGIMTSPTATGTFQKISTITVGGDASNAHTDYEEFVVPFTEYTGEGRYIAIRCGATMGSNVVQILVDDITVEEISATQTVTLSEGWNWWSPTVETSLEELEAALGDKGVTIMSQNSGIATYDGDEEEWSGSLASLVPGQMYLIQVNEDRSFILSGSALSSVTITIEQGSNWFGYTGMQSVTIEQALNGFAPAENDRIFSFYEGFSTYDGEEWSGTITHLKPGHGYIYISQDAESKTINF